jgi:hypothetical protein
MREGFSNEFLMPQLVVGMPDGLSQPAPNILAYFSFLLLTGLSFVDVLGLFQVRQKDHPG